MAWLDVKGKSNLTDAVGREEMEGRRRGRKTPRCGADGGLIEIRILFVGGKENVEGRRRGKTWFSSEGRKGRNYLARDGKANQRGQKLGDISRPIG